MYVTISNVTSVTEGNVKEKKEFAITFKGEVIGQPINKSILKISNNYKPLNNYKQDFHNIFDVCFSAQSFTGATCQIRLTLFKLESNKNKASFFDQERLQIPETSQNLLHPFTEWWSWHTKSLHYGKTHWMVKMSFRTYLPASWCLPRNLFSIIIHTTWNSRD